MFGNLKLFQMLVQFSLAVPGPRFKPTTIQSWRDCNH